MKRLEPLPIRILLYIVCFASGGSVAVAACAPPHIAFIVAATFTTVAVFLHERGHV